LNRAGNPVATPPSLPTFWEVRAPQTWSAIDFISDLHLSEDTPRTFDAWAAHLRHTSADAVFILGDLFEVWVGDDARHAEFESRCAEVLADAASMRTVGFMAGNRDFLVGGGMLRACGVLALTDPTVVIAFGERILLSHGDALCLSDLDYQQFRVQVRSAAWQSDFLSRPLAERRELARQMRAESRRRQQMQRAGVWFDVDSAAAVRWMHEAGTPTLIHGHTHRPGHDAMAPGYIRHVLSDWDLDDQRAPRAEVLRWRRAGLTRMAPAGLTGVPD
jgi:UDP-2,3-diacylglucosamine hydrolase